MADGGGSADDGGGGGAGLSKLATTACFAGVGGSDVGTGGTKLMDWRDGIRDVSNGTEGVAGAVATVGPASDATSRITRSL